MPEVVIDEKYDGNDVTKWLQDREPGTTAKLFPGKHYSIPDPVLISYKAGLTLLGNSSIIHRADARWDAEDPRTMAHLRFVQCSGLVVRGVIVLGPHPNGGLAEDAYVEDLEAQHGIDLIECSWFHIEGNIFADVYGDIIYVGGRSNRPSQIFRINNNWGARTGRQGIAVCNAAHGVVEDNQLWEIRRSMFDTEPIDKTWVVEDVTFRRNITGSCRGYWFAALGEGPIRKLSILENISGSDLELTMNNRASREPQPRSDVKVLRNRCTKPNYGTPSLKVQGYYDVDRVQVRDNFQHCQARVTDFARFFGCTDVDYGDNKIRTLPS